jgi:2-isopropylmalate synthase
MSGKSNVIFWLEQRGFEPTEEIVGKIFDHAKKSDRILSDKELLSLVSECDPHSDQG